MFLGDPTDPESDTVLATLIAEERREAEKERAEAIARIADTLREKIEAEVAVLDDRLSAKIDSKIFDLASLKAFKTKIETTASELKADLRRSMADFDARLSTTADRLERRRDVRGLLVQVASLHAHLKGPGGLATQLKELRERLDLTRADVRALEQVVADAGLATLEQPPVLALPSPH